MPTSGDALAKSLRVCGQKRKTTAKQPTKNREKTAKCGHLLMSFVLKNKYLKIST
jgi:hypothetical protein